MSLEINMHTLIFITTLLFFSNTAYADVGCGPSPRPPIDTSADTAEEKEESSEEGEETANNRVNKMDLALLFLPVIGLTAASRRK